MTRAIAATKVTALVGFLTLLGSSYVLRSEVIALSTLHLQADAVRARNSVEQNRESHADRVAVFELEQSHYGVQLQHYRDMLALFEADYPAYVQRLEDEFRPPELPG